MNKNDLFKAIGNLDGDMLEQSEAAVKSTESDSVRHASRFKKLRIAGIAGIAAVCCILAVLLIPNLKSPEPVLKTSELAEPMSAYLIYINGDDTIEYSVISFNDRKTYGLIDPEAEGLTQENTYVIRDSDIGGLMGTVTRCGDEKMVGCKVYHYSAYPDSRTICILDSPTGYKFYCASYIIVDMQEGDGIDKLFAAYGFPEDCVSVEVCTENTEPGSYLYSIDDTDSIGRICALLSGTTAIDSRTAEQEMAAAWYDAYQNDSVYYDEASGLLKWSNNNEDYDRSYALWTQGERVLILKNSEGFGLMVDFWPKLSRCYSQNGIFRLSEDACAELCGLVK